MLRTAAARHASLRIAFGAADLQRIARAAESLSSPLSYADDESWLRDAVPAVSAAVGADLYTAILPMSATDVRLTDGIRDDVLQTYLVHYLPAAQRRWGTLAGQLAAGSWSRGGLYGSRLREMHRSSYWHDFLVPNRCYDTIGFTLPLGAEARIANVQFYHGSPRGRRFGRRGLAALRLLWPAFVTGVRAATAIPALLDELARAVDHGGAKIAIADRSGRVVHRTKSLVALLEHALDGRQVAAAVTTLLDRCVALDRTSPPLGRHSVIVETPSANRYELVATKLDGVNGRLGFAYLASVEHLAREAVQPLDALDALDLTPREQDVVRLLVSGAANAGIAARLGISLHTARHHTEHVMAKLGVSSRAAVLPRLQRLASGRRDD